VRSARKARRVSESPLLRPQPSASIPLSIPPALTRAADHRPRSLSSPANTIALDIFVNTTSPAHPQASTHTPESPRRVCSRRFLATGSPPRLATAPLHLPLSSIKHPRPIFHRSVPVPSPWCCSPDMPDHTWPFTLQSSLPVLYLVSGLLLHPVTSSLHHHRVLPFL
jgi:hypothetical protein